MATKQRELQRLRQEKHDLKAQCEANMSSLVREAIQHLQPYHLLIESSMALRF